MLGEVDAPPRVGGAVPEAAEGSNVIVDMTETVFMELVPEGKSAGVESALEIEPGFEDEPRLPVAWTVVTITAALPVVTVCVA